MNDQNINDQNMNWDIQLDDFDKESIQNDKTELHDKNSTQNNKTELK